MLHFKTIRDVYRNQQKLLEIGFNEDAILACFEFLNFEEDADHSVGLPENSNEIDLETVRDHSESIYQQGECYIVSLYWGCMIFPDNDMIPKDVRSYLDS